MAKKKTGGTCREAVKMAKRVHKAIHPVEHEKNQKRKNAAKSLRDMSKEERKMRRAELLSKKKKRMGERMAREASAAIQRKDSADIRKAEKHFSNFTGLTAENLTKAPYKAPKVAMVIGRLHSVVYEATRLDVVGYEGENGPALYEHKFSRKNPPLLAVSPDGQQLVIVGGGYRFDAIKGGIIG